MKKISEKQFLNAVERVLNGGNSSLIVTKKVCPFYWTRSKGHFNLHGNIPANSKYLGNIGRGGKESDQYLVCYLADGYEIYETKSEKSKREKSEKNAIAQKKAEAKKRYSEKKQAEILEAESYGITVKELREKKSELNKTNECLYQDFLKKQADVIYEFGFKMVKIVDRVKLARVLQERNISYNAKKLAEIL